MIKYHDKFCFNFRKLKLPFIRVGKTKNKQEYKTNNQTDYSIGELEFKISDSPTLNSKSLTNNFRSDNLLNPKINDDYLDYIEDTIYKKCNFSEFIPDRVHIVKRNEKFRTRSLFSEEINIPLEEDKIKEMNIGFSINYPEQGDSSIVYNTSTHNIDKLDRYTEHLPAVTEDNLIYKTYLYMNLKILRAEYLRKKYKLREKSIILKQKMQRRKELLQKQQEINDFIIDSPLAKINYASYTGLILARDKRRKQNIQKYFSRKSSARSEDKNSVLKKDALETKRNWILKWLNIGMNNKKRKAQKISANLFNEMNKRRLLIAKKRLLRKRYLEILRKKEQIILAKKHQIENSGNNKSGWNYVFFNNYNNIVFTDLINETENSCGSSRY